MIKMELHFNLRVISDFNNGCTVQEVICDTSMMMVYPYQNTLVQG